MSKRVVILTDEQIDRILRWAAVAEVEFTWWDEEDAELLDHLSSHRLR